MLGNASQLIFGGIAKGQGKSVKANQLNNGLTGMLTLAASEQCADMLGDLKTTHLLGCSPRVQLYAQLCGALVSIFMSAGVYIIFSIGNPCINNLSSDPNVVCPFPAPDVAAWRAISLAVSEPELPIPRSSGITAICLGVLVVLSTIIKYRFVSPSYHYWFPNWNAIGIAWTLGPSNTYPQAVIFGAVVAFAWKRYGGASYRMYCYSIAAGMVAGEGLGGIVNAILQIAQVGGSYKGTAVGCPLDRYCG